MAAHLQTTPAARGVFLQLGVDPRTGHSVEKLLGGKGRVCGVQVAADGGRPIQFHARRGVILATGGLSHGGARRSRGSRPRTRGTQLAMEAGARLSPPLQQGRSGCPYQSSPASTAARQSFRAR
ncbi:FAD-binding protein [Cupriavidus necator]|uniref:FAD-binding protein n=1 Tax=Cupriavidus necator TaxID=106590 RepID=UPI0005B44BDA|nr:FAD-binding protein [Cupriavidus necator]